MLCATSLADYADLLSALAGWIPWLIVLAIVVLFRRPIGDVLGKLKEQVAEGNAAIEVAGIKVTPRSITKTRDLAPFRPTITGDPDHMVLLFKATGTIGERTFSKSTKAMEVAGGCLVQVSTEIEVEGMGITSSEALHFVPGVRIVPERSGVGCYLGPIE